ncbi:hypothetical protein IC620_04780 [Hazenella sp. IB182357]|uniref:Uncharacterized protein n=1 Tax=Polycladospora coralii TaxID=2771432 RepID=A0A926RTR5_9BACL|nr:YqhG family protein [Polycladospora coralii]MBD1371672.1 hypothetical protein [Polycladospora coralii]MBS7529139.1 hypothetical protein [Polycladospora coralii]
MDQLKVKSFTKRYLTHQGCSIIEEFPSFLTTQLSIEVDKDLLNRPYYWMYVERMQIQPQPATLCLVFDPDQPPTHRNGEYLFFGAPRFRMLLKSAQKQGRFVRLYQEEPNGFRSNISQAYDQWLCLNFKVSYLCDVKKDRLVSIGIHMHSGEIKDHFYPTIQSIPWTSKLPAHRFTQTPQLTLMEAIGEIEYALQEQLQNEDRTWAEEALERLNFERSLLDIYYPDNSQQEEKKQRETEIIWQYHPRIEVTILNAGLFHLLNTYKIMSHYDKM